MEISTGINIIDRALWLDKEKVLIINDLHLGYEEAMQKKGVLLPKYQFQEILTSLKEILLNISPKKIIINGDLKHEFGSVLKQEWRDILSLLDVLLQSSQEVIIIQGNHDPIIKPIAEKRGIKVVKQFYVGKDIMIVHGDELVKTSAKTIIIGHEHPAITIREGSKWEKYKCFLKGTWKNKQLIVIPCFNPLLEGSDILKERLLSPFLRDISKFEVYIISKGEIFSFGKVKDL
ncbi:metallophosphoesterase [Candidatus Woesearchaeota archaeon]|nr:metallophosphoesterase [Candidatus Woesearchaeota archaeon]